MNPTPDELGIKPCPASGQGCHSWMYGAVHALVANDFADENIDRWITHYLERTPQPMEIVNTIRKVRAEADGTLTPTPTRSFKRDPDPERFKELTSEGPMTEEEFAATSPTKDTSTSEFLRRLFPKQTTILFNLYESQGQITWDEKVPDIAIGSMMSKNTNGAWFLLNPVTGRGVVKPDGKRTFRSEVNLTAYQYGLIESDNVDLGLWLRILSKLGLPLVSVTTSGNKSAHAIVRIEAKDKNEWLDKMSEIADLTVPLGADPAAMTAVRLTRLPGIKRKDNGNTQKLLYFNPSRSTGLESSDKVSENDTNCQNSTDPDKPSTSAEKSGRFEDIYYDGKNFFMKAADGIWRYEMVAMLSSELKCRKISDRAPKGVAMSPMDEAKAFIRKHRRVDGAGPSLYNPNELWFEGGKKYLNTAKNVKITPAAETAGPWGEGFPRYAAILDNVFADPDYKNTFLFWFKRFYESAEQGKLCMGQAMILVGPVHCFKTFLIERLLAPAMGGYADLSSVVSGEGNGFNADLFQSPLAIIDDSRAAESESALQRYASYVKKLVAHGKHKYHEKYLTPIMVEWRGRVIIAANDDPVSIKAVPALDMSNEDKIIALALKTYEEGPIVEELKDVETELPALLAWIKAWEVPTKYIDAANRYIVRGVIAQEVRDKIDAGGKHAELRDLINAWWGRIDSTTNVWEGTAVEFLQALNDTFDNTIIIRDWPVRTLSTRLSQLVSRQDPNIEIIKKRCGAAKLNKYRLTRPTPETVEVDNNPY
jgi:hypothetical protein